MMVVSYMHSFARSTTHDGPDATPDCSEWRAVWQPELAAERSAAPLTPHTCPVTEEA